ncbi:GNAT family N-acetyltransferase [Acuticoccus sp. MNP-M23]|uniref:GNAT family N-acetyltransferase n=1 Tax=Acuticoccus sp. MNP-M23 TaxID=3072793 RepID=UPI002814E4F9|nr:GNAT family N-acetyltransferase [Acuticoccus sp. MNP-M23]WMS41465.1 GNAT family N-acetyltransferase [Acuticoccus sp. MNP-M23]
MTLTFREATEADVAAVVALLADDEYGAARETVSDPPAPAYLAAFRRIAENPRDTLIVGVKEGAVVACAQLTILSGLGREGQTRALVEDVRVASACRGQRIGEALFDDLAARARKAGCAALQLTSNVRRVRTRQFYERIGFEVSHAGFKRAL